MRSLVAEYSWYVYLFTCGLYLPGLVSACKSNVIVNVNVNSKFLINTVGSQSRIY